jgi:hypothetical protein
VPLRHLVLARLVLLPHEARPVVTMAEPTMADKSVAVARRAKEAGMRRHSDFFKRTRLRLADITEERALEILDNLIRARDEHDPLFPPRWACVKVEPPPIDGKAIKRELFAASLAAYRRLWHGDDATDGAQDRGATDDGGSGKPPRPVFGEPVARKRRGLGSRERDELLFGRPGERGR